MFNIQYIFYKWINKKPETSSRGNWISWQTKYCFLLNFCKISPCKVNLIEYNPIGDDQFIQAEKNIIKAYVKALEAQRITVTVRRSRGKDIDAACGQLANKDMLV